MRFTTARQNASCGAALALSALLAAFAVDARAVTIAWTPVGNPGNAADPFSGSLSGAVPYAYNIDKYEVTNGQYADFLNAVASVDNQGNFIPDTYGLYSSNINGINRTGVASYRYVAAPGYANLPVDNISWGDAARFANWLSNGQPTGGENVSTTEDGSYFLHGAMTAAALNAVTRKSTATIVIPSANEWYKAAYYNPATRSYFLFPTSSDAVLSNAYLDAGNNANFYDNGYTTGGAPFLTEVGHFAASASPYGTFDQGGNAMEWIGSGGNGGWAGGSFLTNDDAMASGWVGGPFDPTVELSIVGFRVAMVPEPSSGVLAVIACGLMWWWRKRFK